MKKNKKIKFNVLKNKALGDKKAFEIIKKQLKVKPDSLIGLASGKTTDGLYMLISRDITKNKKFWSQVKLIQIDENYGMGKNSSFSFNFELRHELKPLIKILKEENVFFIDGKLLATRTIKKAYDFINKNNGIDLIILGIGQSYDAHIAYNTCGFSSLNSKMRLVKLHPEEIKKIKAKSKATIKYGLTLGIMDILNSKKVLLIAYGKEKVDSLSMAFKKKVNLKKATASALQLHNDVEVVLDKDAGHFV